MVMSKRFNNARKTKPKKSKSRKWLIILFLLFTVYCIFFYTNDYIVNRSKYALENVQKNYGNQIDSLSTIMDLPSAYIKALIMLESSGRKPYPSRFEEHVYEKLLQVKAGKREAYENITKQMLQGKNDYTLRCLASSWGPFQIMGYKCVHLRIKINSLSSKDALYWGMKWINDDYGYVLREKRYRDAFHLHNTGKGFPNDGASQTYNPQYVMRGMKYMKYFSNDVNLSK